MSFFILLCFSRWVVDCLQASIHIFLENMAGRVHAYPLAWLFSLVEMFDMCSLPSIGLDSTPVYSFSIA